MKIQVKQEHIDKGKPCKSKFCPIVLALIDAGIEDPKVHFVDITTPSGMILLPKIARDFIRSFDYYYPVEPFDFKIKVPFRYQVRCALKSIARLVRCALESIGR